MDEGERFGSHQLEFKEEEATLLKNKDKSLPEIEEIVADVSAAARKKSDVSMAESMPEKDNYEKGKRRPELLKKEKMTLLQIVRENVERLKPNDDLRSVPIRESIAGLLSY